MGTSLHIVHYRSLSLTVAAQRSEAQRSRSGSAAYSLKRIRSHAAAVNRSVDGFANVYLFMTRSADALQTLYARACLLHNTSVVRNVAN